jgi:hypothetical protein
MRATTRWLLLVYGVGACGGSKARTDDHVGPPLGSSTRSAGDDPSVPPPDSAGVPPVDQPSGSSKQFDLDGGS